MDKASNQTMLKITTPSAFQENMLLIVNSFYE